MLRQLAVLLLASAPATQPRPTRTWYEAAEAGLLCTGLASDEERRSLGAPTVSNPRDSVALRKYFGDRPRDERHARLRYLATLASIGWWANRVNDQSIRINVFRLVEALADGYAKESASDPLFRQIARCASTQLLSAALELQQPNAADAIAQRLVERYRGELPTLSVEDWPLILAAREARLDPAAKSATERLGARNIELAGSAMRATQFVRASRLIAAGAGAIMALGDTAAARDLALRSLAASGKPPSIEAQWRAFPILFDGQIRVSGLADAAKLSVMLEQTKPPVQSDQRDIFHSYNRLAIAAEAREDYAATARHGSAAFAELADLSGLNAPSLLFYRTATDLLLGQNDSITAAVARHDPRKGASYVTDYLEMAESLIRQEENEFVDDARGRTVRRYKMDNVLFILSDLARVMPGDRSRITNATFRLAQARSFGRLNLAAVTATARRANVSERRRFDLDRFFSQATQNGRWLRLFLGEIVRRPTERLPDGDAIWQTMFALSVFQNETTKEFPRYLALIRREVPELAGLLTPKPLPVTEFQRRLQPDEALVATAVTAREIHTWVLTRTNATEVRQPVRERALLDRIMRLRTSLTPTGSGGVTQVQPFDAGAAHDLYRLIFAPIANQLRDVRSVVWYGNGPLGSIPPGVLISAPPPRPLVTSPAELSALPFLVDRYAFSVLPELSLFPVFRDRALARRQNTAFFGIGAPLVSQAEIDGTRQARSGDLAGGINGVTLANLPKLVESVDEMKGLAALFGESNSTLWLGAAADEERLAKADLSRYRTLAFATHGFLADEVQNVREPSLMLALKPNAKDRFDGILTATEVALLRLDADLVILSACNTGSADGRPSAETFSGLTQAFLTAGARNLMVSHWPVVSGAAVRLSVETTRGVLSGAQSLPRSLQAAVQALRQDAATPIEAHPAYWGAFVIVGDGR